MLLLFEGEHGPRNTLKFIEEKLGIGLWSWDIPSNKMQWSRGIYHLLGHEPGTLKPSIELIRNMIHPSDRLAAMELSRLLHEGLPIDREFRIIRMDGRIRWLRNHGEVLMDQAGRPQRAIGVMSDITRRHEAQTSLRASEERYRVLAAATSAIVWKAFADGTVADIPEWREITGQSVDEIRGTGWLDAVHGDDRAAVLKAWRQALENASAFNKEFRVRTLDGGPRCFSCHAAPIFNSDGSVREWVGVLTDLSNRPSGKAINGEAITGAQVRGARAILNWSVKDVADAAQVSASTVRRIEEHDGPATTRAVGIAAIRQALESGGVEFIHMPSGRPGVRPRG